MEEECRDDCTTESQKNKTIMKQHKPKTMITKSKEKKMLCRKGKEIMYMAWLS